MAELKKHASLEEQVQRLIDHGLIITDKETVKNFLFSVNYYRLTGYLHDFKIPQTDTYRHEITFDRLKGIYAFDRKFNRILMFALEDIEETLKTRLSYCLTSAFPDDPLIYLNSSIYRSTQTFTTFQRKFFETLDHNKKLPFVEHHNKEYDGKLPMWVAVELFTMGNLHAVYDNLLTPYQKAIAKTYCTGPIQLSNWIENLTYTRNHLAHNMRIYNFNFIRTPAECRNHRRAFRPSHKIFDQIYVMRCMYSDKDEWNHYILMELKALLEEYGDYIALEDLGFPEDWETVLTTSK